MIGIYKITSPSNRIYVGQSNDVEVRIKHYSYIYKSKKQTRLHASFLKHGVENHIFEILQECTILELNDCERYWQDFYNVTGPKGLNCDLVDSSNAPKKRSAETIEKIRIGATGNKNFLGKKHTEAAKLNMSKVQTGRKTSEETKQKLRLIRLKQVFPENYRQTLSDNNGMKRTVLNLETGIFHYSVKEVSITYNLNQNVLIQKLGIHKKNNTQFIYI